MTILLLLLFFSMRFDEVKHRLASYVSVELTGNYGIPLDVKSVEVRSLNDLRLKDVVLFDLAGDTVLYADEARVYLQTKMLLENVVRVNTLVFAAPDIRLRRETPDSDLNIQFIIDIINGNKKEDTNIDLSINQLLVYDGRFTYDVLSEKQCVGAFDPNHISVSDFACNLSLNKFRDNELDLFIRSISGKERCGLSVERLRSHVKGVGRDYCFENLDLRLPVSRVVADKVEISADSAWSDITFRGGIRSDLFAIDDVAPFVKFPYEGCPAVAFSVDGFCSRDSVSADVSAFAVDNSFGLKSNILVSAPFTDKRKGRVVIDECFAMNNITEALIAHSKLDTLKYDVADKLGDLYLKGSAFFGKGKIQGKAMVDCRSGSLALGGSMASDGHYSLTMQGIDLQLKALTGVDRLSSGEINLVATGNIKDKSNLLNVNGDVRNLVYNDYEYAPLAFNGEYNAEAVAAKIVADDPNVQMQLTARYNIKKDKSLKLYLKSDRFVPANLNLYKSEKTQVFAFDLNGDYIDYGDGKSIVNAKIDNLSLIDDSDTTFVRNFYVSDNSAGDERLLMVTSDFANVSITGEFDFKSIIGSLTDALMSHLPVLEIASGKSEHPLSVNDFYYDVSIRNTIPLTKILNLPVTVLEPSSISGAFSESENIFTVDANINKIDFDGGLVRSVRVNGMSHNSGLKLEVQSNVPIVKGIDNFDYNSFEEDIVVRASANVASDNINGVVAWNNYKADDVMTGTVRMNVDFSRNLEHELELAARISKDNIVHKNKVWHINEGIIYGEIDKLFVENVGLSSDMQELKVDGVIGREQSDSLNAYLKNVDVATVFDFIKLRVLEFGGKATGTAHLTGLLSSPNAGGRLSVSNFSIDNAVLGLGDIYVGWEDASKSIVLDAGIYNKKNEVTTVKGFLSQPNDTITLMIDANNLNVAFLDKKLRNFLSDLDGTGSGRVHLNGGWRAVDLEGAVALHCSAKVNANNTRYYFNGDSLRFAKGVMTFANTRLFDKFGNKGSISGALRHQNLGKWACDFNIYADRMLVYDTNDFGLLPFYGTVFATGNALIKSDASGFLLKTNNMRTMPGSRFVYDSNEASGARDNSFVTFTDNSKSRKLDVKSYGEPLVKEPVKTSSGNMTLDFMFDINESLELKVYTNRQNDDYISLYGNGPINAVYNNKTGFSMKGNLNLARGSYKFTIQDIFPKVFEISKGSTLSFNGDPYKAELNLKTKYLVPSASLSDLTTEIAKRKTVKVNCLMNITGSLESPDLEFDLELPEGSEEERELLASVASTPDQKNMQFVYLLGVGKFYTFDANNAQTDESSHSSTAMESLISNTISGQLNNMLGKIINSANWNISGNIATSERGWNSMEVEGMLRGRLLNNRLQINGNLGYRENPIANRNFIGDFELLWLLSPKYNWNIKAYSKTNDRYFSKTDLTTQGVGTSILFEFDRWKWWGDKKNKKKDKKKKNKLSGGVDNGSLEENAVVNVDNE